MVLVELGVVEQRYQAVLEVLSGVAVTDVARRYGVARQTVHAWLRRYARSGLAGLVDRSSKPKSCPHQMPAGIEARVVELRRAHPGWGPRTIGYHLAREGVSPLPSRSSIYRALLRHNLVDRKARKRRRSDYKRWERSRAMELWQMDVMGGVRLVDGTVIPHMEGVGPHLLGSEPRTPHLCKIRVLLRNNNTDSDHGTSSSPPADVSNTNTGDAVASSVGSRVTIRQAIVITPRFPRSSRLATVISSPITSPSLAGALKETSP